MAVQDERLEQWIGELTAKAGGSVISNKDIMNLVTEKNLSGDDLSNLYEALHDDHYEVNFDVDVSDEDLELLEEEEALETEETESQPVPDLDNTMTIDDPVKMYLKEIGALRLLDSEEEIVLAKKVEKAHFPVPPMRTGQRPKPPRKSWRTATFVWWCPSPRNTWDGASSFWTSSRKAIWAF